MAAVVEVYRWTRAEYERMAAAGVFPPDIRAELIAGEIFQMTPQSSRHSAVVSIIADALHAACGQAYVRVQMPLALTDDSEPEPDIAVVAGHPRDYLGHHPEAALLVVEVADTSLDHDRRRKLRLYAQAQVPEYWLVDLNAQRLEVYRRPQRGSYQQKAALGPGDTVRPQACDDAALDVADLLP